jgi:hypothetical protein
MDNSSFTRDFTAYAADEVSRLRLTITHQRAMSSDYQSRLAEVSAIVTPFKCIYRGTAIIAIEAHDVATMVDKLEELCRQCETRCTGLRARLKEVCGFMSTRVGARM